MLAQATLGAVDAALNFSLPDGKTSDLLVELTGAFSATLVVEVCLDGQTWVAIQMKNVTSGTSANTMTTPGVFQATGLTGGLARVRMSVRTSGSAVVSVSSTRQL